MEEGSTLAQHMSEKGVLQLLLDLRFLRTTLAEGRSRASAASSSPAGPAAPQPRGSLGARGVQEGQGDSKQLQDWFQGLETMLQVRAGICRS